MDLAEKSPEEWFVVSLSGLAGREEINFKGAAALRRNQQEGFLKQLSYEGKLRNHDDLTMQTSFPVEAASNSKAALSMKSQTVKATYRRQNGAWAQQSELSDGSLNQFLARFNPLEQMEQISSRKYAIREEVSAARGTKVLRIEIAPEDARAWLSQQLSTEMEQVRDAALKATSQAGKTSAGQEKITKQVETLWDKRFKQMEQMLAEADVMTIYHLTIDRKSSQPLKMTSEIDLRYIDLQNTEQLETVINEVNFTF